VPSWSARKGILGLRITRARGRSTIELDGELDLSSAGLLREAIRRAEASAAETITVDLRQVQFVDLSAVRALLDAAERLGGRLTVRRGPAAVHAIFRATGTEAVLRFEP